MSEVIVSSSSGDMSVGQASPRGMKVRRDTTSCETCSKKNRRKKELRLGKFELIQGSKEVSLFSLEQMKMREDMMAVF